MSSAASGLLVALVVLGSGAAGAAVPRAVVTGAGAASVVIDPYSSDPYSIDSSSTDETPTPEPSTTEAVSPDPPTATRAARRSLTLSPAQGVPGSPVRGQARGFGACPPSGSDDVGAGDVTFSWDGVDALGREPLSGDGSATTTFLVPESASLDAHTVVASCVADPSLAARARFVVTQPDVVQAVVPNVIGRTVGEARTLLEGEGLALGTVTGEGDQVTRQTPEAGREVDSGTAVAVELGTPVELVVVPDVVGLPLARARTAVDGAGLVLGGVSGEGDLVRTQSPRAGSRVPRGTSVDVVVGAATAELVPVPDLVGLAADDVPALLEDSGLVLGPVSGRGEEVVAQNPDPGTLVVPGSAVGVSVQPRVAPPPLVQVPDLVGETPSRVRPVLESIGLALGLDGDGEREITGQQPAPGTLVPLGTTVTVSYAQSGSSAWWWLAGGLLALVAGTGVPTTRALRAREERRWVRSHVRVAARDRPPTGVAVTRPGGHAPGATRVVSLVPRGDDGTHTVEEVHDARR